MVRIIKQSFTNLEAARSRLLPMVPGLADLLRYRRSDLSHDVVAGLAVAAVTVPVGIANAQLAGLPPATGLYASILPLVVYAVFGTSRQLIVGSSAAASAVVASAIAPLAGGDPALYLALSMMLALFVGLLCIAASFLRLGAIADFLSKPILVGFMNGLSISIVLSQAVGILSLAVLVASGRYLRRVPAALLAMLVAGVAAWLFSLEQTGVSMIGKVPAGLPMLSLPRVPLHHLPVLLAEAAGLALVSFSSMMLVARSFADKNRYDVDADREIAALGAANIAAAMSQSFVVTGSGARTAVAESAGGRTQVAGLVAAAVLVPVLLFVTGPLQFVPTVALAAILITTGLSLINWEDLRAIYRIDSQEFWLAMIATVGVLLFGAIQAILFVVVLALLRFVRLTARPNVEILGELAGNAGYQSIERHPAAASPPGLVLFRYNGPIVFFSAPHFKKAVRRAAADAGPDLKWFVIDLLPVSMIDATGLFAIRDEFDALRSRGIVVAAAGRDTEWADRAARRDLSGVLTGIRFFPTLRLAEITYRAETQA